MGKVFFNSKNNIHTGVLRHGLKAKNNNTQLILPQECFCLTLNSYCIKGSIRHSKSVVFSGLCLGLLFFFVGLSK